MPAELERDGYLVLPGALGGDLLRRLLEAVDRVYEEERAAGRAAEDGSLHLLDFLHRDAAFLQLLDLPDTLSAAGCLLGWNIYAYHCHLDVHPPSGAVREARWLWHQDGGRQNLELETEPTRPRLSLKVAYFLTDVSAPGCGNLTVVPGSHVRNMLSRTRGPEPGVAAPEGAVPVLAPAGTAVVFDRRLWHARGENTSELTRKALFVGYTYRWIRPRENGLRGAIDLSRLTPLRRQLLGAASNDLGYWIPTTDDVPLRAWLAERGLLDPARPSHR
jgi:ectoine hydroxylase-related dioxygenase (phytanoyl-CoA dioxygenase family)